VATALIRSGLGCAILPGLALINATDLVVRPITPPAHRRLYAVYRTGANARPSMATALTLLRKALRPAMSSAVTGRLTGVV
jgi:DNA-binding transcriptional LysR family regulator